MSEKQEFFRISRYEMLCEISFAFPPKIAKYNFVSYPVVISLQECGVQ